MSTVSTEPTMPKTRTGMGKKLIFAIVAMIVLAWVRFHNGIDGIQFTTCFLAVAGGFLGTQYLADRGGGR